MLLRVWCISLMSRFSTPWNWKVWRVVRRMLPYRLCSSGELVDHLPLGRGDDAARQAGAQHDVVQGSSFWAVRSGRMSRSSC